MKQVNESTYSLMIHRCQPDHIFSTHPYITPPSLPPTSYPPPILTPLYHSRSILSPPTSVLRSVATKTEGYSGREISKLAIAWQAAAYGNQPLT